MIDDMRKLARQGEYVKALSMLLDPDAWRGLSLNDYTSWAQEIWHILALRATRRYLYKAVWRPRCLQYCFRGQDRLFGEYLLPRRPPGEYNPREYLNNATSTTTDIIQDSLYGVLQMRVGVV